MRTRFRMAAAHALAQLVAWQEYELLRDNVTAVKVRHRQEASREPGKGSAALLSGGRPGSCRCVARVGLKAVAKGVSAASRLSSKPETGSNATKQAGAARGTGCRHDGSNSPDIVTGTATTPVETSQTLILGWRTSRARCRAVSPPARSFFHPFQLPTHTSRPASSK